MWIGSLEKSGEDFLDFSSHMFDFNCIISKGNAVPFTGNERILSLSFLKDIPFIQERQNGKNFSIQWLRHTDIHSNCSYANKGVYAYILGNIFTNQNYETKFGKSKKLYPEEIYNLFNEFGKSLTDYIKGIFLLLIFNENSQEYLLFTSRSGLLDVYFYHGKDFIILSSSIEFIVKNEQCKTKIDKVSLIQHHIYDYPLGDRTLFNGILSVSSASLFSYNLNNIKINKYFDYAESLQCPHSMSWAETWEQTPGIFNKTIDLIHSDQEKICSALTSGFDSRSNLSRLLNSGKEILYYSWGMPGSNELKIPSAIAAKLGFNYKPILLNGDFEEKYDYYAKQAVLWSDGRGTIRRANHTYGYSILSEYSRFNLTGLVGSELIRPTNAVGHIFNEEFIEDFYSENPEKNIESHLDKLINRKLINEEIISENRIKFFSETIEYFRSFSLIGEKYKQLYYFSLTEGFKKYFGHEIHGCRIYNFIQTPYVDDDFIDFILESPVPTLNIDAFRRNPKSLRLGQLFYIPILKKNKPILLKIRTGRFYKPSSLTSKFYPLSVLPGYLRKLLRQRIKKNDTFDTPSWNNLFIQNNKNLMSTKNSIFNPINETELGKYRDIEISKFLSVRYWLNEIFPEK
jgi:hypothetical protein